MTRGLRRTATPVAVLLVVMLAGCSGDAGGPTTTSTTMAETTTTAATVPTTTTTVPPEESTTTTTTLPGPENRILATQGDENPTVEATQFLLNCALDAGLTVDADFGPATFAAVVDAQEFLGRTANGKVDDELLAALARRCNQSRTITGVGDIAVVGNAAPGDPEVYTLALLGGGAVSVEVEEGDVTLALTGPDEAEVATLDGASWSIEASGDHLLTVATPEEAEFAVTFTMVVTLDDEAQGAGAWILATNGISYHGTKLSLGQDAGTVIDKVFDYLGHGVRGRYAEFDTGWYEGDTIGLRGVFIEGLAFLFYGPHTNSPNVPETLARIRYEGGGHDTDGNPRPATYVMTAEGVTVGHTLAQLQSAYGSSVKKGSNAEEHYYRYADRSGELCFYFGPNAPGDDSRIVEIATQCRQ